MRRREFLMDSLAVSALAALEDSRAFADTPDGWGQLPGILARIVPPVFPNRDFVISDYGAVAGAQADCRPAITAAIEACNHAGGGRVVVPAGAYLVKGPIRLLSNVNLYLEASSFIFFDFVPSEYLPAVEVRWQGIRCMNYSPLIYAYQQSNIAITGMGLINGQASSGWDAWLSLEDPDYAALQQMAANKVPVSERVFGKGHFLRPTLFEPYMCNNILVENVTFIDSPFWTVHPTFCTNVTVRNVTVMTGESNDDGCDPDSCQDVLIDSCSFYTADDNISIKAGSGPDAIGLPACTNIVIQNCRAFGSGWSAYTMGSSTTGGISNFFMQNCFATHCVAAFYIKSNNGLGGSIQNVFIRSCNVGWCHHLLFLQTDYGGVSNGAQPPLFKNINLQDVTCSVADVSAFWLEGEAVQPIQQINLSNIAIGVSPLLENVTFTKGLTATDITLGGKPAKVSA